MSLKVLHVISGIDPVIGGPVAALKGLVEAQARAGLEVSVAATWCKGANMTLAEQFRQKSVTVHLIGPAIARLMHWHPQIKNVLRRIIPQADVVHVHALWEEIQHQAAAVAREAGRPCIMRPCGMLDPWSLKQKWLKKWIVMACRLRRDLDCAAAIHFTAEGERDLTLPLRLKSPAIVEPIGIDLTEFEHLPPKGAFRAKYPQIGDKPLILFLGRIHPGKGVEYLIPALAKLLQARKWPDGKAPMLAIVGPDSKGYQAEMEAMARDCGVVEHVVFTGMMRGTDRVGALADADLFALPSEHENFGVVVIEALAAGTPVIISDQVQIYKELQDAGVAGVVPVAVAPLAEELTRWLANKPLRLAASARAGSFVRERYDWRQIALNWLRHYRQIMEGHYHA